ncbi:MAG: hypothetical protein QJT81_01935 [Candidatus Thiothrix putei]|uniref:Uncharacterized protein n=1 Tax=Candidatus Thiothrix putei TaxID=3080811 RepID=A0AA95HCF2_9GAMM|nr:MAG: hypothetical protein QJT81_01935 [Candidatus Thiothrix putei]
MLRHVRLGGFLLLTSIVAGCGTPSSPKVEMSAAEAEANRAYLNSIQQEDRDIAQVERMREVEAVVAIEKARQPYVIVR